MLLLRYNTSGQEVPILMVDSSDHITGKTGLTLNVQICKSGQTTFSTPNGTVAEIGNGRYKFYPAASDLNALGPLIIQVTAAGADPQDIDCLVVNFDPYSGTNLGLAYLDAAITSRLMASAVILGSGSVVSHAGNAASAFKTTLTGSAIKYVGMLLKFSDSAAAANEIREIISFDASTGIVMVNREFSTTPADGDTFVLLGYSGR